jgi:nicotinate-nucleotide pyrophosphorylase (carboxylating)
LIEDLGEGDITTGYLVPLETKAHAAIVAREDGIVAGLKEAVILFETLGLETKALKGDGSAVKRDEELLEIRGDASAILTAERTALNLLGRMSGIATETHQILTALRRTGYKVRVACTRKTAPGLRYFDKRAVELGGGDTHRLHLDDMILIKDNHITVAGSIEEAISRAKAKASFSKKIEVEVGSCEDALKAAGLEVDAILLDNMAVEEVSETLAELERAGLRRRILVEVSGGIGRENIIEYAAAGPDVISLGYITTSPHALDVALEIKEVI